MGIHHIQVTLDAPKENHDITRITVYHRNQMSSNDDCVSEVKKMKK